MPRQQRFLTRDSGGRRIEVLKTYDRNFAREAFEDRDEAAQARLWQSLGIDESYDLGAAVRSDRTDILWEEMSDAAREDGNLHSFFVVTEALGGRRANLYVSPDWPSAEKFAKSA